MSEGCDFSGISKHQQAVLLSVVAVVASCGLLYELLISSLSTYLLGSSVLHFSVTIGLFMFFMGVGSFLSRFVGAALLEIFIFTEIGVGILGGISALCLHATFSYSEWYYLAAFSFIAVISCLVGLEIPLVTRMLEPSQGVKDSVASVFAFDYLGALFASILFPIVLLPYLGTLKTALVIGLLNLSVAAVTVYEFGGLLDGTRRYWLGILVGGIALSGLLIWAEPLASVMERAVYQDEIMLSKQSAYQKIVLTKYDHDVRLFLNGNIQFSSIDEYRYHEPLVHIPLGLVKNRERILLLGAGDGLALREVLKYPDVREVVVVDLDPEVVKLGQTNPILRSLNKGSFDDARVTVVLGDAFSYLKDESSFFTAIIADLPDPNNHGLGKLYSKTFYELIRKKLAVDGYFITQASSPYYARRAFWSIHNTLSSVFAHVTPLQVHVPSFGPWGYQIAANREFDVSAMNFHIKDLRFLEPDILPAMSVFDADMNKVPAEVNLIRNQVLVDYYEQGWEEFN